MAKRLTNEVKRATAKALIWCVCVGVMAWVLATVMPPDEQPAVEMQAEDVYVLDGSESIAVTEDTDDER